MEQSNVIRLTVCQMVQHGVAAIVGPTDPSVAAHVQSMAEILKVPHIETRSSILLTHSHPNCLYWGDLCSWTLITANIMLVSNMQSDNSNYIGLSFFT